MRTERANEKALDAFVARKAEIDTMLTRLATLSDEHFGYVPDEINWSHVGTLACQSALNFDPVSASNFDPFARRGLRVALVSSELAGIAETRRARVA